MALSIILLVYNEVHTIESEIKNLHEKVISKLSDVEFIVAEDGSTDGTKALLHQLKEKYHFNYVEGQTKLHIKATNDDPKSIEGIQLFRF